MDWFLYDNSLRHERVERRTMLEFLQDCDYTKYDLYQVRFIFQNVSNLA